MKSKKIIATFMTIALLFSMGACSKKSEETEESSATTTTAVSETTEEPTEATTTTEATPTPSPVPETEATTTVDRWEALLDPNNPLAINPFTGLQDMDPENVGKRGISVVINNHRKAIPQRGLSSADVYYEYETEGGQTRMLITFADVNNIPEVGSIRSARILSTDIAAGMDTIFFHWGRNRRVPDHISEWGITHYDLNGSAFSWREKDWSGRDIEHTGVSSGEKLAGAIEKFDLTYEWETPKLLFSFVPNGSKDLMNAASCDEINVYFSSTNPDAKFTYNPETGLYTKTQYGDNPQIDELTGEQIAVTNVIVLYADIVMNADGYTIDALLENGGTGYYVSDGKICDITWTKDTPLDMFKLYNANGEEIEVNCGKSYICVVDNDKMDKTTYTANDVADE